ncbi:SNF2 family N-terminal domain-containing protein [Limtongia smithiae]|uniref:SNF2 family N-terminal domain-containing protein n=1 Tax=Limtongia smithiae TaxID=1125753 RepID=UPI0034CDD580
MAPPRATRRFDPGAQNTSDSTRQSNISSRSAHGRNCETQENAHDPEGSLDESVANADALAKRETSLSAEIVRSTPGRRLRNSRSTPATTVTSSATSPQPSPPPSSQPRRSVRASLPLVTPPVAGPAVSFSSSPLTAVSGSRTSKRVHSTSKANSDDLPTPKRVRYTRSLIRQSDDDKENQPVVGLDGVVELSAPSGKPDAENGDEDDEEIDGDTASLDVLPRIKIVYKVPAPIVAQPAHIPAEHKFPSLEDYLTSFRSLDDDVTEDAFEQHITEEVELRARISEAVESGEISLDSSAQDMQLSQLRKPFEPPRGHAHWDYVLSQGMYLSKLAADERRNHTSKAKRVAAMVQTHFKRLSGADEKERKLEERRLRQLAKRMALEVKRKWRLAEKAVRMKMAHEAQEQQRLAGKEQLNSILDQSAQLLEARKDLLQMNNDLSDIDGEDDSDDIQSSMDSEMDMSSDDSDSDDDLEIPGPQANGVVDGRSETFDEVAVAAVAANGSATSATSAAPSPPTEPRQSARQDSVEDDTESRTANEREISVSSDQLTPPTPVADTMYKTQIPFLLRGKLREYQHSGLDWLAGLYNSHTNGILADEMGLGKTIQTISLLSYLACEKQVWGPHLIVVPTSVMLNWEMEFKRFAPGFRILTYYGNPGQRKEKRRGWNDDDSWDVCITSYQLVIHDQNAFRRKQWQYMILDEAHNIKNFRSQRWQALLNFKAKRRLLLTGTPLQNNLVELWSLLYFLMPSSKSRSSTVQNGFASLADFQEWFSHPVDRIMEGDRLQDDAEARSTISKLHKVLRPYLLRRLKADVEKQMPAKYEHIIYCKLSKRQRYLYDDFMSRAQTKETLASGNFLSIINCLMQLRKVCNHPDLFEVRPIVTSFAMERSVAAPYEIKELFVRKRLLESLDRIDLQGLNMVPAKNERMTTWESDRLFKLCANSEISSDISEMTSGVADENGQFDFSSIDAFKHAAKVRREQVKITRWKDNMHLNELRCTRRPIYGRNVVDACKIGPPESRRDPAIQRTRISQLLHTVSDRAVQMQDTIDHYACLTPAVVAMDVPKLMFPEVTKDMIAEVSKSYDNPMHQAQVKLSIAFPDKRLLQYDCGKLQRLATLLHDLTAGGHRALIFTQMTKVLDILEKFLNIHGYRYLRLDGATKIEQRQIMTERFNADPRITVFILSTRSGGLGINLTGADTVIFYDSDWNPSMDKQCQDRCHRIGQTRDVHIYRFVSEYTIESNILRKANQKRLLDDIVIQEGDFTTDYFTKLSLSDMLGTEVVDDAAPSLVVDSHLGKGGIEKAMAMAEDEADVVAAREALKETSVDNEDFYEHEHEHSRSHTVERSCSPAPPPRVVSRAPETAGNDNDGEDNEDADNDEEEEDGIGSVDEYMIHFIEQGYYWD